jgi:anti-anti-sigma regulatory factor
VTLALDDSFSINRSGLAALTRTIQQMRGQNIRVLLTHVTCNYSRLFKMMGLDKLADIRETRVEE